jgi:hypothetical protein
MLNVVISIKITGWSKRVGLSVGTQTSLGKHYVAREIPNGI